MLGLSLKARYESEFADFSLSDYYNFVKEHGFLACITPYYLPGEISSRTITLTMNPTKSETKTIKTEFLYSREGTRKTTAGKSYYQSSSSSPEFKGKFTLNSV